MPDRFGELLLKAVRQLDQDEQDEVLAELLSRRVRRLELPPIQALHTRRLSPESTELAERISALVAEGSGDLKMLPVRLPAAEYERLRAWAREHNFSMAVIIRTLVERFLDEQEHKQKAGA